MSAIILRYTSDNAMISLQIIIKIFFKIKLTIVRRIVIYENASVNLLG